MADVIELAFLDISNIVCVKPTCSFLIRAVALVNQSVSPQRWPTTDTSPNRAASVASKAHYTVVKHAESSRRLPT